ncbi:hypothetical protein G6F62_013256 [Rhizopus arrhizus]|nr:hypothetical protein G6F62_013256 [Rhizopus arrhizus]
MKLSTLSFALLSVANCISFGTAAGEDTFQLALDYRVPKNIAFSCHFGGSSPIMWVLSILEELAARGHHTTFYTRDDQAKFIKNFPTVDLVSDSLTIVEKERFKNVIRSLSSDNHVDSLLHMTKTMMLNFTDGTCQTHKKKRY